jgi:2-phospho-L-lactate guanylyltransferase
MLDKVLTALQSARGVGEVRVIGGGREVERIAADWGASWVHELGDSLNSTLSRALKGQKRPVGIVLGDLPLLRSDEIEPVLRLLTEGKCDSIIAPDSWGTGTNAVFATAPRTLQPSFGPGSLLRYRQVLASRGQRVCQWRSRGLSVDVDTPTDLARACHFLRASPRLEETGERRFS